MLKLSENSTQNMPKLPVAGVLGGAFRHGSTSSPTKLNDHRHLQQTGMEIV
jgi:hypothetical protein